MCGFQAASERVVEQYAMLCSGMKELALVSL